MSLQLCNDCKFVQLDTVVEPSSIYNNYLYFTKSSINLKKHFLTYAKDVIKILKIKKPSKILDIGSNDGMLLSIFQNFGHNVYGVEPFKEAAIEANKNKIKTYNTYFNKKFATSFISNNGKLDIICVNNLFANIDNLDNFTKLCFTILNENGYLIIESSYLFDMLNNQIFDFVYHEHLSYFSIIPLTKFMKTIGFEIFDIKRSDSKGGSLRYVFKKTNYIKSTKLIKSILSKEKKEYSNIEKKIKDYSKKISQLRKNFEHLFISKKYQNIAAFGASATTTTFLSETKISNKIKILIDQNPKKIGRFSPGYHIQVKDISSLKLEKIDLVIIIAWRYAKQIAKKLKKYKLSYVIPLPKFRLYKNL